VLEVEVLGVVTREPEVPPTIGDPASRAEREGSRAADARIPVPKEIQRLCELAAGSAGVRDGHLAIEFVDEQRIAELNERFRARPQPTDVLSFPIDGTAPVGGERELGDVVICLAQTVDVSEAIVHGVLHLLGMDHETDDGEMLALQDELLARERSSQGAGSGRPA
jgi:probable rRNA maturation factor